MASGQTNTNEAVAQAVTGATKEIQTMAVAGAERTHNAGSKQSGPMMKHPTFNWELEDKYNKLKNFTLEVNNIFKSYSMPQVEQIAIINIWLGRKGLQFLKPLPQKGHERSKTMEGLFTILNHKFKQKYNEIIK